MEAPDFRHHFGAGSQHQVVRVGEHDLGSDARKVSRVHPSDRSPSADRHESGRHDVSVAGGEHTAPGTTVG